MHPPAKYSGQRDLRLHISQLSGPGVDPDQYVRSSIRSDTDDIAREHHATATWTSNTQHVARLLSSNPLRGASRSNRELLLTTGFASKPRIPLPVVIPLPVTPPIFFRQSDQNRQRETPPRPQRANKNKMGEAPQEISCGASPIELRLSGRHPFRSRSAWAERCDPRRTSG